jgi:hypothetical protein
MLYLFDKCYRKGDPKLMHVRSFHPLWIQKVYTHPLCKHCAQTLLDFNGGASCVQVYVNQHDFFINRVRETKPATDSALYVPRFFKLYGLH